MSVKARVFCFVCRLFIRIQVAIREVAPSESRSLLGSPKFENHRREKDEEILQENGYSWRDGNRILARVIGDVGAKQHPGRSDERPKSQEEPDKEPNAGAVSTQAALRVPVTSDGFVRHGIDHEESHCCYYAASVISMIEHNWVGVNGCGVDDDPPADGEDRSSDERGDDVPPHCPIA